jgi:hypothetical protein
MLLAALAIGVAARFRPAQILYAALGLVWLFCFGLPWLLRVGLPWVAREARGLPEDARYYLRKRPRRGGQDEDRARGRSQPPPAR